MSMIMMMSAASGLLGSKEIKEADFDDIINLGFDQFEELPDYVTPAPGYATFAIKDVEDVEVNQDEGLRGIRMKFEIKEYQEVSAPKMVEDGKATTDAGGIFSMTYTQGAGLQRMVSDWRGVAAAMGATSIREMVERLAGNSIQAEVTLRASRNKETGETRYFPSIRNITISA